MAPCGLVAVDACAIGDDMTDKIDKLCVKVIYTVNGLTNIFTKEIVDRDDIAACLLFEELIMRGDTYDCLARIGEGTYVRAKHIDFVQIVKKSDGCPCQFEEYHL